MTPSYVALIHSYTIQHAKGVLIRRSITVTKLYEYVAAIIQSVYTVSFDHLYNSGEYAACPIQ